MTHTQIDDFILPVSYLEYVEEKKSILYREEVPLTHWVTIMIGLFITILTPTLLLEIFAIIKEPKLVYFYLILDLFFIATLLNFRKLVIEINSEKLVASFGLIKKTVKLADIVGFEHIVAKLSVFTGMGIRVGGDGSLAYLPSLGDAVKLYFKDSRPFVFSTKNHNQVLEILGQL